MTDPTVVLKFTIRLSCFGILVILLALQLYRIRVTKPDNSEKRVWKFYDIQYAAILTILSAIVLVTLFTLELFHVLLLPCNHLYVLYASLGAFHKIALYSFTILRCQMHERLIRERHIVIAWVLVFTVVIFIFYAVFVMKFNCTYNFHQRSCVTSLPIESVIGYTWFGFSDTIISLYCLILFVLPLRRLILHESNTLVSGIAIKTLIKKIVVWSCVCSFFTFAVVSLCTLLPFLNSILWTLENTVSCICVTMQFSTSSLPVWVQNLCKGDCIISFRLSDESKLTSEIITNQSQKIPETKSKNDNESKDYNTNEKLQQKKMEISVNSFETLSE